MARQITMEARDIVIKDFQKPQEEVVEPQDQLEVEKTFETMTEEELDSYADQKGLEIPETPFDKDAFAPHNPYMELSEEELDKRLAELDTVPAERAEPLPTQLEFTSPEITDSRVENIEERVSGKPRAVQAVEQFFEPFKEASLVRNVITSATRTEEETEALREDTFQTELQTKTPVFEIDKRIREIHYDAESRDITDEEWDELEALQEQRDAIWREARVDFDELGTIVSKPDMSVVDMLGVVVDQPGEFGRIMANELARNPYEMMIPMTWFNVAKKAKTATSAITSSQNVIRGAEIVGTTAEVAALSAATAYAVDAAEQHAQRGTIDQAQALEQAKVGAIIGSAIGGVKGAYQVGKEVRTQNKAMQDLLSSATEESIDDYITKSAAKNIEGKSISVDTAGNTIVTDFLDPAEVAANRALDEEFAPKAIAELVEEQQSRFDAKLTKAQRKDVGVRIEDTKNNILNLNARISELSRKIVDLNEQGQVNTPDVKHTRHTIKVLEQQIDEQNTLVNLYESMLVRDRDLGKEILRTQELNKGLDQTEIKARVDLLIEEAGLERPTKETAQQLADVADDAVEEGVNKNPKLLEGVLLNPEKSFSDMRMKMEVPADGFVPHSGHMFKATDTIWNFIVDKTYGQSVSLLDNVASVSPTARKLRNIMRHDGESLMKTPAHTDRIMLRTGEFTNKLKNALMPLRKKHFNLLDKDAAKTVVRVLRGEDSVPGAADPDIQKAAQDIREILIGFVNYARDAGHEVGFQGDYFPRIYSRSKLMTKEAQAAFLKVLSKHGVPDEKATQTLNKILVDGGVVDFQVQTLQRDMVMPNPQPLNRRSFDFIPDAELAPFLEDNLYDILNEYFMNGVRTVEFTRSFGRGGRGFLEMYESIVKEVREAGGLLDNVESDRMFDLVNALHGNYGQFSSRVGQTLSSAATVTQQILTLPLATLTSVVEPFIGLSRVRTTSWIEGFGKALKAQSNRTIRSIMTHHKADKLAAETEELGLVIDAALGEHLGAVFGGEVNGKKLNKVSATFFRANLLQQWTSFVRTGAFESGKVDIIKNLKLLADPELPDFRRTAIETDMKTLGIDMNAGIAWVNQGADVAKPFYKELQEGALRYTNEVMVHPDATNRPIFFSSPKTSIFNQLLSYPIVFSNTVMHNWYKGMARGNAYYKTQHGLKTAAAMAMMYMASDFATSWREHIQWGPEGNPNKRNQTQSERSFEVLNRAGLMGPAQLLTDAYTATEYGSDAVSSRMGPTVSLINQYFKGFANLGDDEGDTLKKAITRSIPLANIFNNSREFVYREILDGGDLIRDVNIEAAKFETKDPTHQPVLPIWKQGKPVTLPPVPIEGDELSKEPITKIGILDPETGEVTWQ